MKIFSSIITISYIIISANINTAWSGTDTDSFDFRKVRWGMSKDEVKTVEDKDDNIPFLIDEDTIAYNDRILGKNVRLVYYFNEDKLFASAYLLSEKYINKNKFVDDYDEIVSSLKLKYGKPKEEITSWSNDFYNSDYTKRGMAYSMGHVKTITMWGNGATDIVAQISGENFDINVRITYYDRVLYKEYSDKRKKKQEEKL